MKLITLSGVDGSGKSTQLELLQQSLEQAGHKVFYFHAVEFSLANRLSRRMRGTKEFSPGQEKASTHASWFSICLRKIFLFIDIVRFRALSRRLIQERYDFILSDRYFYDSVINILYLSGQTRGSLWLEQYIVHPDTALYMNITPEQILQRERVPEQGYEYLERKLALFGHKKDDWRMISMDASRDKTTIHTNINQLILSEADNAATMTAPRQ